MLYSRYVSYLDEVSYSEEWVFAAEVDGHTYRVVWAGVPLSTTGYVEHQLLVQKDDGRLTKTLHDDSNIEAIIEAAISYRISQLQDELNVDTIFWQSEDQAATLREAVLDLARRSWDHQFLGQYSFSNLNVQNVARILKHSEADIFVAARELLNAEELGLMSAILIPLDRYKAAKHAWEQTTGHQDFDLLETGDWSCGFCGALGYAEDEINPSRVPCTENAYVGKATKDVI